jgi:putative FmdB family regulatory protein
MPTYEYKCDACGHAFEQFHSMTAAPIRKCPACKKLKVKRLIGTGAGLIFKGSGFYITDYRDQSYADKAKAESGAGNGSKTEAAPAAGDAKAGEGDSKKKPEAAAAPATAGESKPAAAAAPAAPKAAEPKAASKSASKSTAKRGK